MLDKGQGLGQGLGLEYDDMSKAGSSAAGGSGGSSCVGGSSSSSSSQSSSLLSAAVYQHTNPLYYRQVLMDGTTLLHPTLSRYL